MFAFSKSPPASRTDVAVASSGDRWSGRPASGSSEAHASSRPGAIHGSAGAAAASSPSSIPPAPSPGTPPASTLRPLRVLPRLRRRFLLRGCLDLERAHRLPDQLSWEHRGLVRPWCWPNWMAGSRMMRAQRCWPHVLSLLLNPLAINAGHAAVGFL